MKIMDETGKVSGFGCVRVRLVVRRVEVLLLQRAVVRLLPHHPPPLPQPYGDGIAVLEGERAADALYYFIKEAELHQSLKHPGLRRRLFGRLCGAAADAGAGLDCSESEPRILLTSLELTYNGIKTKLRYFQPDPNAPCIPFTPELGIR